MSADMDDLIVAFEDRLREEAEARHEQHVEDDQADGDCGFCERAYYDRTVS